MATAKKQKHDIAHHTAASAGTQEPTALGDRHELIATAAYYKAEARGFSSGDGDELADWLAAEAEIESMADVGPLKSRSSKSARPDIRLAGG